ncbi:MAG: MBOAT family protein [Acidimicrobiia bacterium]|nr:MBOAT family protein [Acidimicrobiia bacterium]
MLFNSLQYGFFLVAVVTAYYALRRRSQNLLLLVASYVFYGFWDWRFLGLIVVSTVVDFGTGQWIQRARTVEKPGWARMAVSLSLMTNLGILGFFKYFNFFVDSAVSLLDGLGLSASGTTLNVILPVGISFYTFQTLSYTIDIYRGNLEPTRNMLDFALFVAFFPQLVAGPIERATHLLPQIQMQRVVTSGLFSKGLYLIGVGLVRKVLIADVAGVIADRYFQEPTAYSSVELMAGLLLYSIQIYGDFAGYSNIARGSAMLLGFDLMRNFHHPYFARNVADFWRRWHISLSTWLRDYLYITLGGSRQGKMRTYVNLAVTMLLGGLWHGASWNFVLWGGLHGTYLAVHRAFIQGRREAGGLATKALSMAFTFTLVSFTWLPFRLQEPSAVFDYLRGVFAFSADGFGSLVVVAVLYGLILLVDIPQAVTDDEYWLLQWRLVPRLAMTGATIVAIVLAAGGQAAPFIYFQF